MAATVLVVDDHADFRSQAAGLLRDGGFEVVGTCGDGRSALDAIARLRPDVVLLDVQLPDLDGFEVLARLEAPPGRPVVVLVSSRERADYGSRVAACGAAGFISKAELTAAALRAVVAR